MIELFVGLKSTIVSGRSANKTKIPTIFRNNEDANKIAFVSHRYLYRSRLFMAGRMAVGKVVRNEWKKRRGKGQRR